MSLPAVVVAALVAFGIGGAYWAVFTPAWSRYLDISAEAARPSPTRLGIALVTRVFVALILAVFAGWAGVLGAAGGAEIGFLAWLGFVLPPAIGQAAFEGKSWQVLVIGLPESLIGFVVMGAIVGVWT
ncbi:MAG TPA: DUF1761 domain-containing protein [Candidatus Deferrimicrobium sp.]|nr:DUF1761 domain-containing protein [Candidatus Deferrimicrobium sp.]